MFILGKINPLLSRYNLRDAAVSRVLDATELDATELDAYDSEISTLGVVGADFRAHGFGQPVLRRY
jgi:hypothetical protein